MEQTTSVSSVHSESGRLPSKERFRDIEQEYSEQWHLLANLGSGVASAAEPVEGQVSPSSQNSGNIANIHLQDIKSNDGHQGKEGSEEWFVLGDESAEGIGTEVPLVDEEMIKTDISDSSVKPNGEHVTLLSPYAEQWHELENLKASVRSLSNAVGLPQSPQTSQAADGTLASALSSGSLSVEALNEVGLQHTEALPQEGTVQDGVAPVGAAQGAVDVHEDDPTDSGTSFSMDESGAEGTQLRNQWFPLRPSAVGEDDDDTNHVTHAAPTAAHSSNSDRLQNIPHAWSDDGDKQSPPERSQPDGRDGPDLKRTPWTANTYVSTQQTVAAPAQSQDPASGTAASKDSGSDMSVLSQPHSDHNVTPLDIITRSVPPAKRGVSLMSELKQRHGPQLNSDSDTESPVSKLLGPNFRVVQQVLDRLKQDRLADSVTDEAEGEAASDGHSVTEESVKSMSSAGMPATSAGSRVYGVEQTSGQASFETKSRSSVDSGHNYETLSSRLPPSHNEGHAADRNERLRRLSNSNVQYLLDCGPSAQNLPPPLLPITYRYLSEQSSRNSIENSLRSSRIAWGEHTTPAPSTTDLIQRTANEGLPSSKRASQERDTTSRSSIESSISTARAETWLPMSFPRELSNRGESGESSSVIPADNLAFPDQARSVVDGKRATPDTDAAAFSSAMERSKELDRTGRDQGDTLQSAGSLHHVRDSDRSGSTDDTDDLLTYEPVLEGDRQYLRMQKRAMLPGSKQEPSGADGSSGNRMPVWSSRDAQPVDNVARMSSKEQSLSTLQSQVGIHGAPSEVDDNNIKSLHWSLGAGTISPISATSLAQVDPKQEKSSTPLGPASERPSLLENGTLQEQSLEEDETLVQIEDHDVAAFKQTNSRSTTDVSSSDEIYRPVLHRDASANKENRPNESVFKSSSYGIYDIRRSSGPGSTNRRRKALGLEPNPARQTTRQDGPGLVYISGSSTPSSVRDGRGRPLKGVEDSARPSAYRDAQLEQDHYEGSLESNEELLRPRQLERDSSVLKSRQVDDFRDQYQDRQLVRGERWSQRHQARSVSSRDIHDSYSTPEQRVEPSYKTSDKGKRLPGQYMDKTVPHGNRRSTSSGKSRRKYTDDSFARSSQQSRLEKTTESRKHTDATTRHRSRDRQDSYGARATRLDANISKLTSLISKSMDESISSSSQTSVVPAARWSSSKSRKQRMTSSSESSDVSEFFNYAFLEPHLRSSIKHKVRLRELLKSVKSRDMSPIVRARDSTTTASNSYVSSNEGEERERTGEREKTPIEREPHSAVTQPRRSDAFEVPFFDARPTELEPKCTCNRSRKGVVQTTFPAKTRKIEGRGDGGDFWLPRKRDVGVNCPTPVITRSPVGSSDGSPRAQLEDASTQTVEIVRGSKANRKIEVEPLKSRHKVVKSPPRIIEERGVISQPSPKKSDYIYSVDHREAPQHQPRERLIASQNSPDHGIRTSSDRTSRAQVPAWFHPMTGKPQIEQRSAESQKTPSRSRTNDELRVDVFDAAVNSSSSLQKLSLQEAFFYAKSRFVKRSQERVAKIEQAAREKEKRKMITEAAAEERRIEASKAISSPDIPKIKTRMKAPDQLQVPKPRQMTRAEIKEQNKRLYKNLPEVKAKHEQMKRQAFYRTNRLRAQLYDKRVRNRLKGAGN